MKTPRIPFTRELREIVEKLGWTFYQIPPAAPSWDEIEKRRPVENLEVGHMCIFAPIPQEGQSLREAYSITRGIGPSLLLDGLLSWEGFGEYRKGSISIERPNEILFTRLWFPNPKFSVVFSPRTEDYWDPSMLSVKMDYTVEAFKKFFRIVKPEDYGMMVPKKVKRMPYSDSKNN